MGYTPKEGLTFLITLTIDVHFGNEEIFQFMDDPAYLKAAKESAEEFAEELEKFVAKHPFSRAATAKGGVQTFSVPKSPTQTA